MQGELVYGQQHFVGDRLQRALLCLLLNSWTHHLQRQHGVVAKYLPCDDAGRYPYYHGVKKLELSFLFTDSEARMDSVVVLGSARLAMLLRKLGVPYWTQRCIICFRLAQLSA